MDIVISRSEIDVCRDTDDNKFLECAVDSNSLFIVSGDKDLLIIKQYGSVEIITAKDFCDKYLTNEPLN